MPRLATAAVGLLCLASACGGAGAGSAPAASGSRAGSTTSSTSSAVAGRPRITKSQFDTRSATYFPTKSASERLEIAQNVCTSIRSHGNNFLSWLTDVHKDPSLFPYRLAPPAIGAFAGLAVSYSCPDPLYFAQLQQGLAGIPSGSNLGSTAKP